jgi:hypothetical protein
MNRIEDKPSWRKEQIDCYFNPKLITELIVYSSGKA